MCGLCGCQRFLTSCSHPSADRIRPCQAGHIDQEGRTGGGRNWGEGHFFLEKARFKLSYSVCGAQVGNQTAAYCPVASSSLGWQGKSFLRLLLSPWGAGFQVSQEQSAADALMEGRKDAKSRMHRNLTQTENRSFRHPQMMGRILFLIRAVCSS